MDGPSATPEAAAIRVDDAAKMLGVSRRTVQTWAQDGTLPHKRIGKVILFSPRKLREWMDSDPSDNV